MQIPHSHAVTHIDETMTLIHTARMSGDFSRSTQ